MLIICHLQPPHRRHRPGSDERFNEAHSAHFEQNLARVFEDSLGREKLQHSGAGAAALRTLEHQAADSGAATVSVSVKQRNNPSQQRHVSLKVEVAQQGGTGRVKADACAHASNGSNEDRMVAVSNDVRLSCSVCAAANETL